MAERQVTHSRKDGAGDILALCHPGQWWSPRTKHDTISDIETGQHSYFVHAYGHGRVAVQVAHGLTGKYLRTDADGTGRNNLDDLPNC